MDTASDPESILPDLPQLNDDRNPTHSVINARTNTISSKSSFTVPSLENKDDDIEIKEEVGELYLERSVDEHNSEEKCPTEFLFPQISDSMSGSGPPFVQVMGSIPTDVIKSEETDYFTTTQFTVTGPKTRRSGRARNTNSNTKTAEKHYKCRYCDLKFENVKTLSDHEKFHKTFECSECDRKYLTAGALNFHIRRCHIDTGHKTWQCTYCDSKFETSELRFNHEEETHRDFVCTEENCEFKFYSLYHLNEHIWKCHKKTEDQDQENKFRKNRNYKRSVLKQYTCKICKKKFNVRSTLSQHKRIHFEAEPIPCNQINCGETFTKKSTLKTHLRKIHGEGEILKPHECTECEKKFGTKLQLIVHSRKAHTGETPYKCMKRGCTRRFYSRSALEAHVKYLHTEGLFPCTKSDCLEQFSSKSILTTHLRRIHGEGQIVRPYECTECQKKFSQKAQLIIHKRRHTGETPYKCELPGCTKRYSSNMALRAHVKLKHTNRQRQLMKQVPKEKQSTEERALKKCDLCDKTYAGTSNLNVHRLRAHATPEDKKYTCDHCDLKFVMNCDREKHMLTHSSEKRFQCHKCEAMFKTSGSLKNHIIFKHRYDEDVQRQYWGQK